MDTDICHCTKAKGEHGLVDSAACLNFTLDRKATYWAEKNAAAVKRSEKLVEDIKAGRVRVIKPLESMVTREATLESVATPEGGDLLGALAKRLGMEPAR